MKSVFIIGNGPSALNKRLGGTIDSADVVVRLNDFKIVGYEEFVGTKTDILFTCRLNEYLNTISDFQEVILYLLMNPLDGVHIPPEILESPNISKVISWSDITEINKVLNLREDCYMSTGMSCILEMVSRFGHVNIIGFDNFEQGNQHYYEEGPRIEPTRHDGPGEKRTIKLLNHLNLITYK